MGTQDLIYCVSIKYEFGAWKHRIFVFDNEEVANKWLTTEEDDFRSGETFNRARAIELAGLEAVEDAESVFYNSKNQ